MPVPVAQSRKLGLCCAQLQLARSHGLPAVRMAELRSVSGQLGALAPGRRALSASLLREWLGPAATTGALTVIQLRVVIMLIHLGSKPWQRAA